MGWWGAEEMEESNEEVLETACVTVSLLEPLAETGSRAEELALVERSG